MLLETSYKMKPPVSARLNTSHLLADKLIVGYLMNEGSGVIVHDYSGRGHHGTLTGGATWAVGKFGSAVQLDGVSGFVDIAASEDLSFLTGSFSVGWLLKYPVTQSGFYAALVVDQGWNTSASIANCWGLVQSRGFIDAIRYNDVGDSTGSFLNVVELDTSIPEGWHYFVFVRDSGKLRFRLYRDGVLKCSEAYSNEASFTSNGMSIGQSFVIEEFTGGIFGNVTLWRRALTDSDVARLQVDLFCMFTKPASLMSRVIIGGG